MKLIDKDALVAEIEKLYNGEIDTYTRNILDRLKSNIDTLEVKESRLPNPRFPHLNNIVDKVLGAGNLESWEYEEAEQLVLLAKEELLKDLEVKEADLRRELDKYIDCYDVEDYTTFAKYFFELGLKAQKGE